MGVDRPVLVGAQYLRAAAAIGVVAVHSASNAAFAKYLGEQTFGGVLAGGRVGVALFFVLSGFIMAYVNLDAGLAPRRDALTFFKERFARIVPMLWLVALAYAALTAVGFGGNTLADCLRAALLSPVGKAAPNVVWTLRQELLFYSLFGLTYMWRLPRWLLWLWFVAPAPAFFIPVSHALFIYVLKTVIFAPDNSLFGLGFALGLGWLKGLTIGPRRLGALALALSTAAVFAVADLIHYARGDAGVMIEAPFCVAAVWASTQIVAVQSWLGGRLRFLGDASYSIYLAHSLAISALLTLLARVRGFPAPAAVAIVFIAAMSFGVLVYWFVERRLVGWTRRALRIGPPAALRFRRA